MGICLPIDSRDNTARDKSVVHAPLRRQTHESSELIGRPVLLLHVIFAPQYCITVAIDRIIIIILLYNNHNDRHHNDDI